MTPVCVVVFFNIFCYSVFPECFFVHVVGGREGVGREKAEHRSLWWERVWEDAPGGSSQHDEGYSQSRNRRESSTAPCCLCCLWRTSQHSRHCGVTFRYKAIVKDVDTKIAQSIKTALSKMQNPFNFLFWVFQWQKSPSLSLPLTHQQRNSQSLWWRNQRSLHWRDLPGLPTSQHPLTFSPSRSLKSPTSPRHHLLQGRSAPAQAQEWPPHALARWSTPAGKSLSPRRSVYNL